MTQKPINPKPVTSGTKIKSDKNDFYSTSSDKNEFPTSHHNQIKSRQVAQQSFSCTKGERRKDGEKLEARNTASSSHHVHNCIALETASGEAAKKKKFTVERKKC